MEKNKLKLVAVISGVLLTITLLAYIMVSIITWINLDNNQTQAVPGYLSFVINLLYFGIPLLIELIVFMYFYIRFRSK